MNIFHLYALFIFLLYFPCEDFASILQSSESDVHPQNFIGPLKTGEGKITVHHEFNKVCVATHTT